MLSRRAFIGTGVGAAVVAAAGFAAYSAASAGGCPGVITCPLTGEKICKDECPMVDTQRADCPGKIECPIDGEPVCADRCPVDEPAEEQARPDKAARSCCEG